MAGTSKGDPSYYSRICHFGMEKPKHVANTDLNSYTLYKSMRFIHT